MGTAGIFQLYDSNTKKYTYYYIHCDSLSVLKTIRNKIKRCNSVKSIRKLVAGLVEKGTLRENQIKEPDVFPCLPTECWPSLEYSLVVNMYDSPGEVYDEHWSVSPVWETMKTDFVLAPHQRPLTIKKFNPKNGTLIKEPTKKSASSEKRPRGRPRLSDEEKATRAAARKEKSKTVEK